MCAWVQTIDVEYDVLYLSVCLAHTPDNSFLGFVSEEAVKDVKEEELESDANRKNRIAVVYGKQDYMWKVQ